MNEQIDREIAGLEKELAGLRRQKLAELQSQVSALQASLGGDDSAAPRRGRPPGRIGPRPAKRGRPAARASKGAALGANSPATVSGPRKRRGRKLGQGLTDAEALAMLTKEVSDAGSEGVSAVQASQSSRVSYPRAIGLMDKHFKKRGSGRWTRYTLK